MMFLPGNHETLCVSEIIQEMPEDEHKQLLNILNQLQEKKGYISKADLEDLAVLSGKPESLLHGLVSFFDAYRTRPLGRNHLSVCYGTACYACGANLIYDRLADSLELDEYGTSFDGFITLDKIQCVGACNLAAVIITNNKLEGKVKSSQMPEKLSELRKKDAEQSK